MPLLTGHLLLTAVVLGALAALGAVVWLVVARPGPATHRAVLMRGGATVALVLVAQGLAVVAVGLKVNDQYGFYASWNDLLGQTSAGGTPIQAGRLTSTGQGTVVSRTVTDPHAGTDHQVLVWLPPQYHQAAYRHRRLPVVMFLPGQPSTPQVAFTHFHFAAAATRAIATGQAPPFIGVFPTLTIAPPRDTQCTNIKGGPHAESWLSTAVPRYVRSHFRAAPRGRDWSVMGFSEGGFCAAKLLLKHQLAFGSAASFAGYYTPMTDATSGSLFGGNPVKTEHNSPTWLYETRGLRSGRLLVIASRQDIESWTQSSAFLSIARGDPRVSSLTPAQGGHNYYVYAALLPSALRWAASRWRPVTGSIVRTAA